MRQRVVRIGIALAVLAALGTAAVPALAQESALDRIAKSGVIKVGWAAWNPYMFRDTKTQQVSGLAVDVMKELAAAMGNVRIEWVEDSWATFVAGLQARKFDIFFPAVITLKRAMAIGFTDNISNTPTTILVRRSDLAKYKKWQDSDQPGKKVVVTLGSRNDYYATLMFKRAQLVRVRDDSEAMLELLSGKADAYVGEVNSLLTRVKARPREVAMVRDTMILGKGSAAINRNDQAFLNWLNLWIQEMIQLGIFDKIYEKWGVVREINWEKFQEG